MKKNILIPLCCVLLMVSCTKDFEEINTNPNNPDKVTSVGLLLPDAIRSSVKSNFYNSYARGSVAANLVASDYASNFSNWARSDANGYFLWNYYDYIRDLNEVISISETEGLKNYKGLALVLRSWMFQCLTDMYGPIPFREAAQAKLGGIYSPAYEQQEQVYTGVLADLEEANNILGTSDETIIGDILYNGDVNKWKMFANGLALRLLLRESGKKDVSAQMTAIAGTPSKYPLFQSYADQAALQFNADREANYSPFYNASNFSTDTKVSKQLIDTLKALNDTRLYVYTLPTPISSAADANGVRPDPSAFKYEGDLNGIGSFPNANLTSSMGMLWMSQKYDIDLSSKTAAQGIIITYSEVQFILAEAAEKGFIPGGTAAAETYYLNGVKDQFLYYAGRIPGNYAGSYLKLSSANVYADNAYLQQSSVAYAGSSERKLQKIWLQKWISHYLVGYEAWFEWRRTGYPDIPIGPIGPGYVPRRALYPADEMRINEDHYKQAVQWLGPDELSTKVWWDQ
ncbi:MAG: SusD/RagB family nutrient-binding outer membrane lipoprotein [Chitinophagaceae bacterium]|nr:SusD/RagB family nutrient-binding outer membrane lipoprotein [Chitinophagaceae bacterium]